jgi:hypothetical protein
MLMQKGLIDVPQNRKKMFGEQPEVLNLRYDPKVSPMNSIPVDLRLPLLRIFMQYAEGAMRRNGKKWMSFDPLNDSSLHQTFAFEIDIAGQSVTRKKKTRSQIGTAFVGRTHLAGGQRAVSAGGHRPAAGGGHRAARTASTPGHRRL